ncbi:NAD(P)-dependent oxidoreductase [Aquisalinus flavus]|uniref:6-phosphogluconate dehydrogenase n=1 Tax=Aquisalinus flavus TaxID=1526572 RepID=A0A8J2Y3D6_9PROT|nr:NAD(P)-dependent oxidoreductase [Aquisalinus flavus]MBD0427686.1 NAD(P)-dependent oxidoreductase [Aquisalinus flavus]UNE47466.1 NAD(P)-dependent oxidoreductase [Aquisalinus flavus]GGD03000.1 6-phosphogluconate dehydrogenase [Aquisalinus flavus]
MKLSFLGLGVMGYPMAAHLLKAGHDVTVFNRTSEKAAKWVAENGGAMEPDPVSACRDARIVLACVGNDDDSIAVATAALSGMEEGALYVDHTTTSAACAEEIARRAAERGIGFVDAPVSGGQAGAENGALSIMCGGSDADFATAAAVMDRYAKRIVHIGPVGHGQLCKAVNQICIAGLLQGLSEAVHFGSRAGIDMDKVYEAVSGGAAQSWQMENRWATMNKGEFDFGFAVDWMRKDLRIALDEAGRHGASLPVTALVDQFYAQVQENGGRRWDTSSLVSRLNKNSS